MNMRVLAVGQDLYWLTAIQKAIADLPEHALMKKKKFQAVKCVADLPRPNASTLLLLDASNQRDVAHTVKELRSKGWKYVIVVAADPTAKQATAVLRSDQGYDYREKTYEEMKIGNQVQTWLDEIQAASQSMKKARGSKPR